MPLQLAQPIFLSYEISVPTLCAIVQRLFARDFYKGIGAYPQPSLHRLGHFLRSFYMSDLFTQAAVAVELFGLGYVASSFAVYVHRRSHRSVQWRAQPKLTNQPQVTVTDSTPTQRKLSPVEKLRQQCQQAGIKWRDAHGKNKHLKKAEMIEALQRLEQAKQIDKPKPKVAPDVTPLKKIA
jgi:hypothetical protein